MNDRSLSVYVKKWIVVFIINKLNFIYFTWFVYTFVNYKYNVLLKRDDMCLIPLSTLVTPSRFHKGKEIRIVLSKMAKKSNAKCCGNVAAMLWQRLDNVGERRCHNVRNRRRHNSHFLPCHNVVTTMLQRCCASWDESGLPCDLSLAETSFPGVISFRQNTQFPRNFGRFARKFGKTFSLKKTLSPRKLGEKAGILRCKRMETIIHFRKNMMAQPSFNY